MKEFLHKLSEYKVLVVGLGKSGIESAKFLKNNAKEVVIQDSKAYDEFSDENKKEISKLDLEGYFGRNPENLESLDLVVVSPGVPLDLEFILKAKENGTEIIGELELAYRVLNGKFIAITGTNGKTTTTSLVWEIFKGAGLDARLVGNIGNPIISEKNTTENTYFITEVSSFQLETISEFRPEISAILNITPDHLDRHKTLENYAKAKGKIYENQIDSQHTLVNFEDPLSLTMSKTSKAKIIAFSKFRDIKFGALVMNDNICIMDESEKTTPICKVADLKILGEHNLENALAATAISFFAGIEAKIIGKVLSEFSGVEHRLEDVGAIDGIQFINDSKGTNIDGSIKAILAMSKPIVLIAGGYDKKADFTSFVDSFDTKVKDLVLIGATAVKIKNAAESKGFTNNIILPNLKEAVKEAYRRADNGDVILLSPACASWDQYSSYEERGRDFKKAVLELRDSQ